MEKLKEAVHYWKIESGDVDKDDSRGIQIKETKGECAVEGKASEMIASDYGRSIKTKKHSIGIEEAPKMVVIGNYWDKETVTQVVDLLKEYEDIFPRRFLEMKGITRSLWDMKFQLKPDAKPMKRRPYLLNPMYKEKVCKELDRVLDIGIIVSIEESK